jgi:hypothetical protein
MCQKSERNLSSTLASVFCVMLKYKVLLLLLLLFSLWNINDQKFIPTQHLKLKLDVINNDIVKAARTCNPLCPVCWALPPTGRGTIIALDPTFESFTLLEPVSH